MSSRNRARFRSIQILRIAEIEKASDVRRPNIKQLLVPKLRFPLPHRVVIPSARSNGDPTQVGILYPWSTAASAPVSGDGQPS
ncbi:uncharacterized protein PGTG_16061 [Puccinia graminis f. sp. tritici CRL 75-36-700-3]|uniref:Large subunit ribosomal protein L18Ae n=1 Tax=Puccinia graminis f. sp. tritici (strain CRL 75-36-700-3 / race SCCL) TaxID=418459 RepID=E3L1P9_PUCGT|nr:uncharacterized protein PGTG_16061 [Puccinia graminis f. sp. tritici CRL 75-36-700-3]EFP90474.2 large subunit ribosomal protein L18Ae [Puccinia graminis f. sp. tritici CRL 75-36-700-3]